MGRPIAPLWLRWSWRDLRSRWPLVTAIALIIALGTGTYAALGSTAAWRRQSNDASFAALRFHDLRVELAQGATVDAGQLERVAASLPSSDRVTGSAERLVGPTQVDASSPGETVLDPGELVGVPVGEGLDVDRLDVPRGRPLEAGDDGAPVAVLEQQYADAHDLPDRGTLRVSGGARLDYVGLGTSPQHFIVVGQRATVFSQGSYAVVFVPLSTAQELLGQPGQVNELVVATEAGAADTVRRELDDALARELPGTGATITERADEPAYRLLYEDIENDQQFWNMISVLILAGAALAAFNLTSRIVEAQRREIGIGMALGVRPARLALRPLLVGAEIAALGAVAGVVVALLLDAWLAGIFQRFLPLPEWRTPFQPGVYARAAAAGFLLPLVATALPVRRAVRVAPVTAIRTGHLAAKGSGLAPLLARVPLPGRTFHQLPIRNLLRTPRRTVLTALAIGAAITTMVATIGLIDSFVHTLDEDDAELSRGTPGRLVVDLDAFTPVDSDAVREVSRSPAVAEAQPALELFGTLRGDEDIDVIVDLLPFGEGALWQPTLSEGSAAAVRRGGIVLSQKAARDLHVDVGDTVRLRHPVREGLSYRLTESRIPVAAVHPGALRPQAYLDLGAADRFDLEGITNALQVAPAPGVSEDEAIRALFPLAGVAAVRPAAGAARALRDTLEGFFGVLRVMELIVLLLALLIAFNATSISMDERRREHATMEAFGLRPRTILGMATVEGMAAGLLGTALGVAAGYQVVRWMVTAQLDRTMPDLSVQGFVSPATLLTAVALGVLAVGVAPLLTARRVRSMDLPATLRVVE